MGGLTKGGVSWGGGNAGWERKENRNGGGGMFDDGELGKSIGAVYAR